MKDNNYDPLRREYAGLADRYDTHWRFYIEASIRETLRRIKVGSADRVLDVGCGTGEFLAALSREVPSTGLVGVDLSDEMLEVATQKLGPDVVLKQANAEVLPFEAAEFDVVVSTNVLHYIRQPVSALQEMHRVLKPGGQIVITDWCDDYLTCRICDLFLRVFSPGHFQTYGVRECRDLLSRTAFENIHVERYKITWLWGLMTAIAVKGSQS